MAVIDDRDQSSTLRHASAWGEWGGRDKNNEDDSASSDLDLVSGIDALRIEFNDLAPTGQVSGNLVQAGLANMERNRYNNVPCMDKTRVVLRLGNAA